MLGRINEALTSVGKAVLSVHATTVGEQETVLQALYRVCFDVPIPHTTIQFSSLERVRSCGFRVEQEVGLNESPYHHHVYFEVPVTESRVQQFLDCLDGPVSNPAGGRKKRT